MDPNPVDDGVTTTPIPALAPIPQPLRAPSARPISNNNPNPYQSFCAVTPEALKAGAVDIGTATRARVCFTTPGFKPGQPGTVEAAFMQYAPAEIITIMRALIANAAGSIWQTEARRAAGAAATKAKAETTRERIRAAFNSLRAKRQKTPTPMLRAILAGEQPDGLKDGKPHFMRARKGFSRTNIYRHTADMK